MKEDIKTNIGSNAGVVAIVSDRFYPIHLPQEPVLPAVVYSMLPGEEEVSHSGRVGWTTRIVQFDCYSSNPLSLESLTDALADALFNWTNVNSNYEAFPGTPQDLSELELDRYRATLDAIVQSRNGG